MLALIAILIFILIPIVMLVLQLTRSKFSSPWLLAVLGVLLAWPMVLLSRLRMPQAISYITWRPETLLPDSPTLLVDSLSWPFGLALATLAASVILTAVARLEQSQPGIPPAPEQVPLSKPVSRPIRSANLSTANWLNWASTLMLTGLGLVAVLSGNLLTLLLGWSALDVAEVVILLAQVNASRVRERIIIAFSIRAAGIAMLLFASIAAWSAGGSLSLASITPRANLFLLLAAGLRLGVLPLHLPLVQEFPLRRGLATALRFIPAAASLILLARSAAIGIESPLLPYLLLFTTLAAVFGAGVWAVSQNINDGHPFWILSIASLAVGAALRTQPQACLAWGIAGLFSGSLIFLTTLPHPRLLPLATLGMLGISSLPFTPAWAGVMVIQPSTAERAVLNPVVSILISAGFLLAHALIMLGYARHTLRHLSPDEKINQPTPEHWIWLVYPIGLAFLPLAHLLASRWLWPNLTDLPMVGWMGGAAACVLAGLLWFVNQNIPRAQLSQHAPQGTSAWVKVISLSWLYSLLWHAYRLISRLVSLINRVLEGDGGILWALVLLALILVFLQS